MPPHHVRWEMSSLRLSTLNSISFYFNVTLAERDTLIQLYRVETWYSGQIIPCQNVTLRSNYAVSERDTTIQLYRVEMWHSDPIIPCWNVTLQSNNIINLSFVITTFNSSIKFHQAFFIEGITSIRRIQEYKFHNLRISDQSYNTQTSHITTQTSASSRLM